MNSNERRRKGSNTLDDGRSLAVEFICVSGMRLLLAIFQAAAGVRFEHAVLVAEVAIAECAVADDALSCILALLEVATGFAGRHDDVFGRGGARREGGKLFDALELVAENSEEKNSSDFESGKVYKGWVATLECQRRREKRGSVVTGLVVWSFRRCVR